MARFRLKTIEVDAVPYRLGLEDAFTPQAVPVLVTPAGRVELTQGDWIVTKATGERDVIKADQFRTQYETCPADRPIQPIERVRKGIPLRAG